jgi:hypothetical protein
MLFLEATRELPVQEISLQTPLAQTHGDPARTAPRLRADPACGPRACSTASCRSMPEATVAHVGIKRNEETALPQAYYANLPVEPRRCGRVPAGSHAGHRRQRLRGRTSAQRSRGPAHHPDLRRELSGRARRHGACASRMCPSSPPPSMTASTRSATSSPVSAMQVIAISGPTSLSSSASTIRVCCRRFNFSPCPSLCHPLTRRDWSEARLRRRLSAFIRHAAPGSWRFRNRSGCCFLTPTSPLTSRSSRAGREHGGKPAPLRQPGAQDSARSPSASS